MASFRQQTKQPTRDDGRLTFQVLADLSNCLAAQIPQLHGAIKAAAERQRGAVGLGLTMQPNRSVSFGCFLSSLPLELIMSDNNL